VTRRSKAEHLGAKSAQVVGTVAHLELCHGRLGWDRSASGPVVISLGGQYPLRGLTAPERILLQPVNLYKQCRGGASWAATGRAPCHQTVSDACLVLRDVGHEHLASPIASTVMGVPSRFAEGDRGGHALFRIGQRRTSFEPHHGKTREPRPLQRRHPDSDSR
jgi:hypothetical protein